MRNWLIVLIGLCFPLAAHVGVTDVFFEGLAGPYPLYVTIRPPVVIPGVAEVSIRSAAKDVSKIRITPLTLSGPGSKYPPTPDDAVRSASDGQYFTGGVWIMFSSAWQVRILVDGDRGPAVLSVPVPAVSQKVSSMEAPLGAVLFALMLVLGAGVVGIAGAAIRESRLAPGLKPNEDGRRAGYIAMGVGLGLVIAIVWFGRDWWSDEAGSYARSIYRPLAMNAALKGNDLTLTLAHTGWSQPKSLDDFILDHGYPMHLYAIREAKLDAIFHLHPKFARAGVFEVSLPALPPGEYRLFADVVHRSGFPETLSAKLSLPTDFTSVVSLGRDDAGGIFPPNSSGTPSFVTKSQLRVTFDSPTAIRATQSSTLRFRVSDMNGNPAANLRSYLEMPAHLAIVANDFSVFSHIHPNGNISMAAMDIAQNNTFALAENVLVSQHVQEGSVAVVPAEFTFPFGFPHTGSYRLVLHFRRLDQVESATFDIVVMD